MTTTPHWFGAPRPVMDPALMAIAFQMAARMLAFLQAQSETTMIDFTALPEQGMLELLAAAGLPVPGDTAALVDEFLEHKRYQGLTDSALYGYRQVLNRLIEVAPWPPYEPRHIIAAVSKERWGYRTRFTMDANARAFCNWCEVQYGIPSASRRLAKMKRPEKRERFLNLESLLAVYEAALTERDRLIIRLCYEVGPRSDEIAKMRPGDVDEGRLTFRGKTGERTIPVSRELTEDLKAHAQGGLLWRNHRGGPMSTRDVTYAVKQIIKRAAVRTWNWRSSVHLLRHSFATHYANNRSRPGGVPHLQKLLGHMQLATTAEYVHLLSEDLADDQERANLVRQLELDFPEDGLVAVVNHQTLNPVRALHAVHLAAPEGRAAHARGAHGDAHDGRRRAA